MSFLVIYAAGSLVGVVFCIWITYQEWKRNDFFGAGDIIHFVLALAFFSIFSWAAVILMLAFGLSEVLPEIWPTISKMNFSRKHLQNQKKKEDHGEKQTN